MSACITTQAEQIGPYAIETRLGVGGQAAVYLARRVSPGDQDSTWVVLKTPRVGTGTGHSSALASEAHALAFVDHPNVVRLFDRDLTSEPPYIVLEHVSGVDLHRLLKLSAPTSKAVPAELACFLCHGVALALSALHDPPSPEVPRIFHGDVSPSNILLSDQGDVKLSDFGLARLVGVPSSEARPTNPPTGKGQWGHRGYLAPERLEGGLPSEAADVFALAVILGELLTGSPVFAGEGELARLISAKEGILSPHLLQADGVAPELLSLVRRSLSPDPDSRPTAFELAVFLERRIRKDAMNEQQLARSLSAWVNWAKQQGRNASSTEEQVRHSLRLMRAAQSASSTARLEVDDGTALFRAAGTDSSTSLSYSELVSLAASGKLDSRDEVALFGGAFEPVAHIPALARHLIPSSTALTSEVSPFGPADYCVDLSETPLVALLGRLLEKKADGLLLVERSSADESARKEIYLQEGRVTHISSTEAHDRLGESLVQAQMLTRQGLSAALRHMVRTQGQLGESLVALRLVDPVVVYQALCSQGRDRIVSLCAWTEGTVRFFSGVSRPEVVFPLDVDLYLCLVQAVDAGRYYSPDPQHRIVPLQACPAPRAAPSSLPLLNLVPSIARKRVTVATAVEELSLLSARGVTTSPTTYLLVAQALGWVDFTR